MTAERLAKKERMDKHMKKLLAMLLTLALLLGCAGGVLADDVKTVKGWGAFSFNDQTGLTSYSQQLIWQEVEKRLGVKVGALATPEQFVRNALKRMFNRKKQYINGFINRLAIVTVSLLPDRIRLIVKHRMLDKR